MSIATASNWLANFVISVTFPLLTDSIGLSNAVFGYMALAAFTFLFVFMLVPETKGKSLEAVTEMLRLGQEPRVACCGRRKRHAFAVNSR